MGANVIIINLRLNYFLHSFQHPLHFYLPISKEPSGLEEPAGAQMKAKLITFILLLYIFSLILVFLAM
jgi:hypothetical protein